MVSFFAHLPPTAEVDAAQAWRRRGEAREERAAKRAEPVAPAVGKEAEGTTESEGGLASVSHDARGTATSVISWGASIGG